jgi:hypothetical protein
MSSCYFITIYLQLTFSIYQVKKHFTLYRIIVIVNIITEFLQNSCYNGQANVYVFTGFTYLLYSEISKIHYI